MNAEQVAAMSMHPRSSPPALPPLSEDIEVKVAREGDDDDEVAELLMTQRTITPTHRRLRTSPSCNAENVEKGNGADVFLRVFSPHQVELGRARRGSFQIVRASDLAESPREMSTLKKVGCIALSVFVLGGTALAWPASRAYVLGAFGAGIGYWGMQRVFLRAIAPPRNR